MSRKLEFKAYGKQELALEYLFDNETISLGFGGAAGPGKSMCGVFWTWAMCQYYPGVRYFWGRNELKRLKETTYVSYLEFCEIYKVPEEQQGHYSEKSSSITFENGSKILFLDLSYKPSDQLGRRFGSMLFTGGFIDESYEVDYRYINILKTRIGRWKNAEYGITPKILETFNPDKGHVYTRFYLPSVNGTLPEGVKFIKALAIDRLEYPEHFVKHLELHPDDVGTSAGIYIENLMRLDEATKQRLLWGNFEYDDDPTRMIGHDSIMGLFVPGDTSQDDEVCITADIAMRGNDKFVICVWIGRVLFYMEVIDICGGKEVVDKIKELARRFEVPENKIVYDADGLGGFIGDEGGFLPNAIPFKNGSRPHFVKKANYQNLKAFCAHKFAEAVNAGKYYFHYLRDKDGLKTLAVRELEQLRTTRMMDDERSQGIISKSEMKRNLGHSPDMLDSFIMRELLFYRSNRVYTGDAAYGVISTDRYGNQVVSFSDTYGTSKQAANEEDIAEQRGRYYLTKRKINRGGRKIESRGSGFDFDSFG